MEFRVCMIENERKRYEKGNRGNNGEVVTDIWLWVNWSIISFRRWLNSGGFLIRDWEVFGELDFDVGG